MTSEWVKSSDFIESGRIYLIPFESSWIHLTLFDSIRIQLNPFGIRLDPVNSNETSSNSSSNVCSVMFQIWDHEDFVILVVFCAQNLNFRFFFMNLLRAISSFEIPEGDPWKSRAARRVPVYQPCWFDCVDSTYQQNPTSMMLDIVQ